MECSNYRGVSWDRTKERWCAEITVKGRDFLLGELSDEVAAARLVDDAATVLEMEGKIEPMERNLPITARSPGESKIAPESLAALARVVAERRILKKTRGRKRAHPIRLLRVYSSHNSKKGSCAMPNLRGFYVLLCTRDLELRT